jgi:hypothetical protein
MPRRAAPPGAGRDRPNSIEEPTWNVISITTCTSSKTG